MINITDKAKCTGCSACYSICPVSCIQMREDEEGFYYPSAEAERCVDCGRCEKVCPVLNSCEPDAEFRKVFICQNKSLPIRQDSTSGGVFSALSQYVLDRDGIVFGAEYDEKFCVRHGAGEDEDSLGKFRGSKYVQSWMGDTFKKVQEELKKDRWVLFSGTPCQVAGLNAFLGKKYEKLILMDIVCYSISSPGVWKKYLNHIIKTKGLDLNRISKIKFRDKTKYGYDYTLMTFYDKQGNILLSEGPESNQMLRSFVSNTTTRPSCYECYFKGTERFSDFTAWDCYNIYQYDKKLDDDKGSSHLMVHTLKGKEIVEELSNHLYMIEVDDQKAIASEPAMTQCSKPSEMRNKFFSDYQANKNVFDCYFQDSLRVKGERAFRHCLSKIGIYKNLKRLLKG